MARNVQALAQDRRRDRGPKGRPLDDSAVNEVRALLGARERRRDLLIEFLHLIQDEYGCLSARHLRALAEEMRLSQAEVYEVASFYDHFDVVKEGETPPAPLTIRVCDSISCMLAGAETLLDELARRRRSGGHPRRARALHGPLRRRAGRAHRRPRSRSCHGRAACWRMARGGRHQCRGAGIYRLGRLSRRRRLPAAEEGARRRAHAPRP